MIEGDMMFEDSFFVLKNSLNGLSWEVCPGLDYD